MSMVIHNISFAGDDKHKGFTLIEMLLVMVIIGMIIVMGMRFFQQQAFTKRIDRTTYQMQQILNASLTYYVASGSWPNTITDLQTANYLPGNTPIMSPWGTPYQLVKGPTPSNQPPLTGPNSLIFVYVPISAGTQTFAAAQVISGNLPLSYLTEDPNPLVSQPCSDTSTTCTLVAGASIPGQNLNNANAVTFAGLYHNGACVPVPQCPVDTRTGATMIPQIMVVPVSVSGVNDPPGGSPPNANVYPISSFTAYATEPAIYDGINGPFACNTDKISDQNCYKDYSQGRFTALPINIKYWRVCLEVITEKGTVGWQTNGFVDNWGKYATIMAITRCAIPNEPSGSDFTIFSP